MGFYSISLLNFARWGGRFYKNLLPLDFSAFLDTKSPFEWNKNASKIFISNEIKTTKCFIFSRDTGCNFFVTSTSSSRVMSPWGHLKATRSFETSVTTHARKKRHISEDLSNTGVRTSNFARNTFFNPFCTKSDLVKNIHHTALCFHIL